jgi:hypothetical protein
LGVSHATVFLAGRVRIEKFAQVEQVDDIEIGQKPRIGQLDVAKISEIGFCDMHLLGHKLDIGVVLLLGSGDGEHRVVRLVFSLLIPITWCMPVPKW